MYKFDTKTLSFYPYVLEADYRASGTWPENGADITDYVFSDFKLKPAPDGMQLGATSAGKPCWVPIPLPTPEEILARAEGILKGLIAEVDSISVVAWNTKTKAMQNAWVVYRKQLVALPTVEGWPTQTPWPIKPEILE